MEMWITRRERRRSPRSSPSLRVPGTG